MIPPFYEIIRNKGAIAMPAGLTKISNFFAASRWRKVVAWWSVLAYTGRESPMLMWLRIDLRYFNPHQYCR